MGGREILVRLLSRNWPFANGAGRLIDKLGRGIDLGNGERVCRTSDGFDISIFAEDHIGRHILLSGQFDRSPVAVLLDFCEAGDRCIDIGANLGYVACVLLKRVSGSHVLAIEPQPGIADLLEKNLARFPAERWTLLRAALSDTETDGFLELNQSNRGASTLVETASAGTVKVPMLPAARVMGELDRLDIMKMDVEGHEETVFRSGRDALDRLQPRAILYEDQLGKSAASGAIGGILTGIGYRIFGIRKTLTATKLDPVTEANRGSFNDFLAVSSRRSQPARAMTAYKLSA